MAARRKRCAQVRDEHHAVVRGHRRSAQHQPALSRFVRIHRQIDNGVKTIVVPHEIVDDEQARDIKIVSGGIEVRNLTFGYQPGQVLFHELNLLIPAGQRVGLVGIRDLASRRC